MGAEAQIQAKFLEGLSKLGLAHRKAEWVGVRGCPDRVVFMPEELIWVEFKAPGKKPRPDQVRELNALADSGQTCVLIDSFEGVENVLKSISKYLITHAKNQAKEETKQ